MIHRKQRVLVAMSGGVDSSVSAVLLREQGYEVEGAFIVTWTAPWLPCTWREERLDALRVAEQLRIPFHTVDLSKEYEQEVVAYMVQEYREGKTPNPDVMCNKHIKFGGFFTFAMEQGFDYVATGHYARVGSDNEQPPTYSLFAGKDAQKDQSYFLWTLTQEQLSHTLFPVGMFEKSDVRQIALSRELETAQKKDSQGICFLGKVDMREFLSHYIPSERGDVLDVRGTCIGAHMGAVFYTIGQRHGFTVAHTDPNSPPLYVVSKDVSKNTITVAPSYRMSSGKLVEQVVLRLGSTNWISGASFTEDAYTDVTCLARFRYRQKLLPASLTVGANSTACVALSTPDCSIAIGQSCVLYSEDECLGGGVIQEVVRES